jgi:hypothetical protein
MIGVRLVCVVLAAWAMNWAVGRPEAAALLEEIPEMRIIGPIAGAIVGFIMLPMRSAFGVVASTLNGIWAGAIAITLSGFAFLAMKVFEALAHNLLKDFEAFLRLVGAESKPLIKLGMEPKLIAITLGATALAGLVAAVVHMLLIRLRRFRGEPEPKKQVRAAVARAGSHI